jgi:hypothetical protein
LPLFSDGNFGGIYQQQEIKCCPSGTQVMVICLNRFYISGIFHENKKRPQFGVAKILNKPLGPIQLYNLIRII